ncbi:MAG: sugar ABC transporter ATP-binding protein [Vicinamibacterales bacterium]
MIAVRLAHLVKRFPGVVALDDVSVTIESGSCHALCGENGAGKSTLGKIVAGVYTPDAGTVEIDGRPVSFSSPAEALAVGIGMVHQELAFCDNLSVAENLCLESLPRSGLFVDRPEMWRRAERMLADIGAGIDVRTRVAELSIGQQQMLQIAAAVGRGARVIVFDEPTSSLSLHESEALYALLGRLRERGVTCIYVSHRMEEIFRLCDTITVLRDGRHVATQPTAGLTRGELVQMMIGRPLDDYFPAHVGGAAGDEMLRVERLTSPAGFREISFSIRAGEVVGLAGLVGAGRSEVAQAVFGLDPAATGKVFVRGRPLRLGSPAEAMRAGLGLVPEDRKRQGLVLGMSARSNATLAVLARLARATFVRRAAERTLAQGYFQKLRVRASAEEQPVAGLSGGNQQKVVLAKWLAAHCTILMLDEPTRGVDVGAKAEIHSLIDELAASGHAVLLISSELPEVLHLSTRILVLKDGRITGALARQDATQTRVMELMTSV